MIPKLLGFSLKLLQSLPYFPLESLHIFGHLIFDIREGEGESSCLIIESIDNVFFLLADKALAFAGF